MTPETKTPTRAEALAAINRIEQVQTGLAQSILSEDLDTIRAALATDAPIVSFAYDEQKARDEIDREARFAFSVQEIIGRAFDCEDMKADEWDDLIGKIIKQTSTLYGEGLAQRAPIEKINGLDEALSHYDVLKDRHSDTPLEIIVAAARLYAQGRTQSAVPEALRTLDWERDLDLLRAEVVSDVVATLRIDRLHQLIEALSAAPPVTGGAWLPIESAPKDGTKCLFLTPEPQEGSPAYNMKDGRVFTGRFSRHDFVLEGAYTRNPIKWQPLPAPPSSAEKEGV